jgi:dTDP-4-dehydrorhamnose 3,5-epimerase
MPFVQTGIADLVIYEPRVINDDRGYFFESFSSRTFEAEGYNRPWVQDNQARSTYGVIRGLHFQHEPHAQTKLIRALEGSILDVVVDIRRNSPTYGKVFTIELTAENKLQLLVPKGFAHGYSVLSETAEILYKCDNLYSKESEGGIRFDDPALNIDWKIPMDKAILSPKDLVLPELAQAINHF